MREALILLVSLIISYLVDYWHSSHLTTLNQQRHQERCQHTHNDKTNTYRS